MSRIAILIEYEVAPEKRAAFDSALRRNVNETMGDAGCLRMEILHPKGDPGRIVLSELWEDRASIDRHRLKPGHDAGHAAVDALVTRKRALVCDMAE